MHDISSTTGNEEQNASDSSTAWVHDVLDADQLSGSKMQYGRRKLSTGTIVILWALRFYVVFMAFIVCLAIWNAAHP